MAKPILQIDAGWFQMQQGGAEVGQIVVVGQAPATTEYYYLYTGNTGSGQAVYTWPSASNKNVTTTYNYLGTQPSTFQPSNPKGYVKDLKPTVQYIAAVCST